MKKITNIQLLTILSFVAYIVYEFYFVKNWAASQEPNGAIIRIDLIIIYLVLAILSGISIYQLIKRK